MKTILLIALAIIVLYFLFEIAVRVLLYVFRRKNDPVRSQLSRVLGEDA